jgi:broad specificity phosphatase PhoE
MVAAVRRARAQARGHEAVCVSHQLPVETLRRAMNGNRLAHLPTRRMCNLASLTSFAFDDDRLVGWGYAEPAA